MIDSDWHYLLCIQKLYHGPYLEIVGEEMTIDIIMHDNDIIVSYLEVTTATYNKPHPQSIPLVPFRFVPFAVSSFCNVGNLFSE